MLKDMADEMAPISPGEVRRKIDTALTQISCLAIVVAVMAQAATAEQRKAMAAFIPDPRLREHVAAWRTLLGRGEPSGG